MGWAFGPFPSQQEKDMSAMPEYQGMALGGSYAGKMLSAPAPITQVGKKLSIVGMRPTMETYYYVPLIGVQGFWIYEEETKGTGPWDDILRLLCEAYKEKNAG